MYINKHIIMIVWKINLFVLYLLVFLCVWVPSTYITTTKRQGVLCIYHLILNMKTIK